MIYSLLVVFTIQTPLSNNGMIGNNRIERQLEIPMPSAKECERIKTAMTGIIGLRIFCAMYDDGTLSDGATPLFGDKDK